MIRRVVDVLDSVVRKIGVLQHSGAREIERFCQTIVRHVDFQQIFQLTDMLSQTRDVVVRFLWCSFRILILRHEASLRVLTVALLCY
jgi:hypothetical protein